MGNEFLDALPIEQLRRGSKGWQKKIVSVDKKTNRISFDWCDAGDNLKRLLPSKTISNEIYEVSSSRIRFISSCSDIIKSNSGAGLFIDYGYTKSHFGDTLQAVKKHKFINVLEDVGNCDITSHIDFEVLSSICSIKTKVTTQRNFLRSLGIEYRANVIKAKHEDLDRLIGQDQMGDLFKVICLYNNKETNPAGF